MFQAVARGTWNCDPTHEKAESPNDCTRLHTQAALFFQSLRRHGVSLRHVGVRRICVEPKLLNSLDTSRRRQKSLCLMPSGATPVSGSQLLECNSPMTLKAPADRQRP